MRATKPPRVFSSPSLRALPLLDGRRGLLRGAGGLLGGRDELELAGAAPRPAARIDAPRFFDARQMSEERDGEDDGEDDVDHVRLLHGAATIAAEAARLSAVSVRRMRRSRSARPRSSSDGRVRAPHRGFDERGQRGERLVRDQALASRRGASSSRGVMVSAARGPSGRAGRRRGARRRRCARAPGPGARGRRAARRGGAACGEKRSPT